MNAYRYRLDKSSKKYKCPQCNKNTLVRFIDIDNNHSQDNAGRCDRESKCGYFSNPSGNTVISTNINPIEYIEPSYHDMSLVIDSRKGIEDNDFIQYLKHNFGSEATKAAVKEYFIGDSNLFNGSTIFWQLDANSNVRHGKIMKYNKFTGKRVKNEEGKALISSVRSSLKLDNHNLKQTLFGRHLAAETSNNIPIGVVESEKTAIIMSIVKPSVVWMATGSLGGVKYDYFKGLHNRDITLYPDKGCYTQWHDKASVLNSRYGFNIIVDDALEYSNLKEGKDIADVFLYDNIEVPNTMMSQVSQVGQRASIPCYDRVA